MAEEKLLTVRDVSIILGISEREVMDLAESGKLPAYKVGGVYLRFKRDQVLEFKKSKGPLFPRKETPRQYKIKNKISDFFHFNDFYILAALIIIILLFVIFRGY
jgi:excisionase family DNA binding protein